MFTTNTPYASGRDDAPKYSNCFRPEVLEQRFTIRSQYLNCHYTVKNGGSYPIRNKQPLKYSAYLSGPTELAPIQWKSEETDTLNRGAEDNGNRAKTLHRRVQTGSSTVNGNERQTHHGLAHDLGCFHHNLYYIVGVISLAIPVRRSEMNATVMLLSHSLESSSELGKT
jgi:hypothetical protein